MVSYVVCFSMLQYCFFLLDPCGMKVCATIGRSLLTVLIRFWQQCRSSKTASCPQELEASITLTECLAKVCGATRDLLLSLARVPNCHQSHVATVHWWDRPFQPHSQDDETWDGTRMGSYVLA